MHGIFLEACRILWNSKKHKQHYDAIAEMNKELAKHDASSASFVCIADVPQHKANAARAAKFIDYLALSSTPPALAVALTVALPCTRVHHWLFESQSLEDARMRF